MMKLYLDLLLMLFYCQMWINYVYSLLCCCSVSLDQDQYVFCHNAVLEYVLCGDTSVSALNLQIHIRQQSQADSQTGKTGFEKDLEVKWLTLTCIMPFH